MGIYADDVFWSLHSRLATNFRQGYGSQPSGAGSDAAKWKPGATVQPVRVREQEIAVLVGYTSEAGVTVLAVCSDWSSFDV